MTRTVAPVDKVDNLRTVLDNVDSLRKALDNVGDLRKVLSDIVNERNALRLKVDELEALLAQSRAEQSPNINDERNPNFNDDDDEGDADIRAFEEAELNAVARVFEEEESLPPPPTVLQELQSNLEQGVQLPPLPPPPNLRAIPSNLEQRVELSVKYAVERKYFRSLSSAARHFKVPYSLAYSRKRGRKTVAENGGVNTLITAEQEKELVGLLTVKAEAGEPITSQMVTKAVHDILRRSGIEDPKFGSRWAGRWLRRQPKPLRGWRKPGTPYIRNTKQGESTITTQG